MSRFSLRDLRERQRLALDIARPLLKAKRDRTVKTAYERITPGDSGRVHTILSPIGTTTFRLSSSESILFDGSTNLQNLVNKVLAYDPELYAIRDCIVPDEGKVLVAVDYAGAEAVLAAAYSKDWPFLDKLLHGADVHSEHAQYFFGISKEEWDSITDKDPRYGVERKPKRNIAKTITYSSFYYAQPKTICEKMNKDSDISGVRVSLDEVTRCRALLLQLHPLEQWWSDTMALLAKTGGVLRNCFGYRRVFRDPDEHNRLKDGLAFYPQSTTAWLINDAVVRVDNAEVRGDLPGEWLLQVHDELLFQTEPENVQALKAFVDPVMKQTFTINDRKLYVPVEWKSGPSWGRMKKL